MFSEVAFTGILAYKCSFMFSELWDEDDFKISPWCPFLNNMQL